MYAIHARHNSFSPTPTPKCKTDSPSFHCSESWVVMFTGFGSVVFTFILHIEPFCRTEYLCTRSMCYFRSNLKLLEKDVHCAKPELTTHTARLRRSVKHEDTILHHWLTATQNYTEILQDPFASQFTFLHGSFCCWGHATARILLRVRRGKKEECISIILLSDVGWW